MERYRGSSYCNDVPMEQGSFRELAHSGRPTSEYVLDERIIEKLHFLTQRVEELEYKLENSLAMRGEDLSFDFSIDESSSIPKIDVKVLTGPKSLRYSEREGVLTPRRSTSRLEGWDEATVESNSSFVILPSSGKHKGPTLSGQQKTKQTLTLQCQSSSRPPSSLNSTELREDLYLRPDSRMQTPSVFSEEDESTARSSVQSPIYSTDTASTCHSLFASSNECLSSDESLRDHESTVSTQRHTRGGNYDTLNGINELQDRGERNVDHSVTRDSGLRYGYTIGMAKVSPKISKNYEETNGQDRSTHRGLVIKNFSTEEDFKQGGNSTLLQPLENVLTSSTRPVTRSHSLDAMRLVREDRDESYQEFVSTDTRVRCRDDFTECENRGAVCDDRIIKSDLSLHNHDYGEHPNVGPSSPDKHSVDNKHDSYLRSDKNEITSGLEYKTDIGDTLMDGRHFEKTLQGHFNKFIEFQDVQINERLEMQMQRDNLQKARGDYTDDNGSHRVRQAVNKGNVNTEDYRGLPVNHNAVRSTNQEDGLPRGTGVVSTPARRVRVRAREIMTSSSSEKTIHRVPVRATYSDPTHLRVDRLRVLRPPERRTNVEEKLRGLIDPSDIGNVHREIASRPRVLMADLTSATPLSPTESGFVEGSSVDSVFDSEKAAPEKPRHLPSSESPYSSFTSISSGGNKFYLAAEREPRVVNRENPNAYHMGETRDTSKVFFIGSELSSPTQSADSDKNLHLPPLRITSENPRLDEFFFPGSRQQLGSPTSSVTTSDFSDSFPECQCEFQCECQTGIATEEDFREELKLISSYVLKERARTASKPGGKPTRRYYLDEEQGEMDIFGTSLQRREHHIVPMLVKVILRLRKRFFGGIEGPEIFKSSTSCDENNNCCKQEREGPKRKISFSPSAMLLSAVGECSASELREVIERDKLDVNQLSPSGKSLLHKAAAAGDLESIHTLIQYGGNVNLTDQDGFAPIHSALRRAHYKCAIFLMECGTDIGAYTKARVHEMMAMKDISESCLSNLLNTTL